MSKQGSEKKLPLKQEQKGSKNHNVVVPKIEKSEAQLRLEKQLSK